LISAFVDFARTGHLELVACAATHGFLPALAVEPAAVNAQVAVGVDRFTKTFGYPPAGIWAPECGYFGAQEQGIYPGLESVFARHGLKYFFTDAHGVLHGTPRPAKGVYAPVMTDSGVAVFGRDVDAARQVWSAKTGYPGDPVYRDFYRDIGFDLPLDYIGPWVQPTGDRKMTGFKYHQITGQSESKKVYNPAEAAHRVAEHAADFVERRIEQIGRIAPLIGDEPVIVAPYDAELFGHWWFEGPDFLNSVFRIVAMRSDQIRTVTPSQVLAQQKGRMQVIAPATSSWGEGGHAGFWINETNHWIYPPIHRATVLLQTVINENREGDALLIRTLKQMARELLLAESSDWAFIIKTGDMAPYAKARVAEHIDRFNQFAHMIQDGEIDQEYLAHAESRTPLFPHIDLDWFVISDPAL
jgi:1,4-alpha-glucan branching enzyme